MPVKYPQVDEDYSWGRTPLVIAQSVDGIHFSKHCVIEDDKERGFCYPAIEFLSENTALISYCAGGKAEGCCLDKTVIKKLVF